MKVLVLAYDFPPNNSIGAQRPWGWYLYFKKYGITPIVITRYWDEPLKVAEDFVRSTKESRISSEETIYGSIIKVPYKASLGDRLFLAGKCRVLRKFLSFLYITLEYGLPFFDRKRNIFYAAREFLKKDKVDVIIATGEPFVLFLYAKKLSENFNIPWIADYRDAWSGFQEITSDKSKLQTFLNHFYFRKIEEKIVKTASLITCPGKVTEKSILKIFPSKKVLIVYNGFFDEDIVDYSAYGKNTSFTIAFGGTMYDFQPFEIFLEGFRRFVNQFKKRPNVKVYFFGAKSKHAQVARIKQNEKMNMFFHIEDTLPRNVFIEKIAQADLLLLFSNKGMVSGKLFDFIKAGRPILCVGKDAGEMGDLIKTYKLGTICEDSEKTSKLLKSKYDYWLKNGNLPFSFSEPDFFSRNKQAEIFCAEIHKLTN